MLSRIFYIYTLINLIINLVIKTFFIIKLFILEEYLSNVIQQYCPMITYFIFWAVIARFLQRFNNIVDILQNILVILPSFDGIFF